MTIHSIFSQSCPSFTFLIPSYSTFSQKKTHLLALLVFSLMVYLAVNRYFKATRIENKQKEIEPEEVSQRAFSGTGKMNYADGAISAGIFKDNKLIEGKISFPDGEVYEGVFIENELRKGTYTSSSHIKWKGTFRNHQFCGQLIDCDGTVLKEGVCVEGKLIGPGMRITSDGTLLKGVFKEDELHGKGMSKNLEGITRKGTFKEGRFIKGIIIQPNGTITARGEFHNDLLEGDGMFIESGIKREGTFKFGMLNGEGIETHPGKRGGRVLKGRFCNNALVEGSIVYGNRKLEKKGTFKEGKLIKGTIECDGTKWEGSFDAQEKLHGQGKIEYSDGRKDEGFFQHGEIQ